MIPLVMTLHASGDKRLDRFVAGTLQEGIQRAREYVDSLKSELKSYALVWNGFVIIEGRRWKAVLVEAGERTATSASVLAQRYEARGIILKKNKAVGNPALIEMPASRLTA